MPKVEQPVEEITWQTEDIESGRCLGEKDILRRLEAS